MQNINALLSTAAITLLFSFNPGTATAQDSKKPAAKAEVARPIPETVLKHDAFTGNEIRLATMHYVNADCSSGPLPVLRIVTAPRNGQHRLEQVTYAVDRQPGDRRANCNGKPVDAVGVFYKSKADYTGEDSMVVDVDFKSGSVRRFSYKIIVR